MAFVSESPRVTGSHNKQTASGRLGPGEYHNEGQLHKMAMEAIYPKKVVPFNSNKNRGVMDKQQFIHNQNITPGKLFILFMLYCCYIQYRSWFILIEI